MIHKSNVNEDYNCNVLIYTCISDLPTNFDKISTSYLMNKYMKVTITNG